MRLLFHCFEWLTDCVRCEMTEPLVFRFILLFMAAISADGYKSVIVFIRAHLHSIKWQTYGVKLSNFRLNIPIVMSNEKITMSDMNLFS